MAYFGTTAATSQANPPRKMTQAFARPANSLLPSSNGLVTVVGSSVGANNQGGDLWFYCSTNLTTDLTASNFFTDGLQLGMAPGDMIMGVEFTSLGSSLVTFLGAIVSVSTAGASLSTGSLNTSTAN